MKAVVFALLAIAVLLAGCSKPTVSVPEQDAEGRYVIHMTSGNRFAPAEAKVPVGATVVWVNDAGVHDVTSHDGSFESPRFMDAGATFEHKFETAGEHEYHCELHESQGMRATLLVE